MRWLKSILREILGLFVEDGSFAIAQLVWLAIMAFLAHFFAHTHWLGIGLFAGLALILIESVLRRANRPPPK